MRDTDLAGHNDFGFMNDNFALRLAAVSHSYGEVQVYENLDLDIARGEFVAVVGPSGCGKTTLLNLLSGFEKPSSGQVERRGAIRTVHQQDGLLPWLTARENIALGLRGEREDAVRDGQLRELLSMIHLDGFADSYPHQLSGGMKQRVELARALAGQSDVLLLDEPFSALDYLTRLRLRRELEKMLQAHPRTVVFVTHDVEEAAQLADRVVVLTERPARIFKELRLASPHPRDPMAPEVVNAVRDILNALGMREPQKETV